MKSELITGKISARGLPYSSCDANPPAIRVSSVAIVCLMLAAMTFLVYLPVRHCDFVLFDDADYVSDNRMVQAGLSWAGIKWAFTTTDAANWHPLTWLSHMLDAQLFGPGP